MPPRLFTVPAFVGAFASHALANVVLYATLLTVPIMLAAHGDHVAARSGLVLSTLGITNFFLTPFVGRLLDRIGPRWPVAIGGAASALGLLTPLVLGRVSDPTVLALSLPLVGAGIALNFPSTRLAAMDSVHERYGGLASGLIATSRAFGGVAGAVLVAAVLTDPVGAPGAAPGLFVTIVAASVAGAIPALVLPGRLRSLMPTIRPHEQ